ncbi:MAG TPA: AI-2E family transporter [Actinomycetota bacterium]|nr:AI-2E family transporter [Actinomycetota bacterium]
MAEPQQVPIQTEPPVEDLPEAAADDALAPLRLPSWQWIWRLLIVVWISVALALLLYNAFKQIRGLVILLIASLFLSFALEPAVSWLSSRGWRRGLATFACLLTLTLVGVLLLVSIIPVFVDQVIELVDAAPEIIDRLVGWGNDWFGLELSTTRIVEDLQLANSDLTRFAGNIAGNVFGVGAAIAATIFQILTIALFTFYLVADGPRFRRAVCSVLPPKQQRIVLDTWEVAIDKTGAYLYSRLVLAVLSGVASYVVMRVLGIEFALPLAVWMGIVSQFIPTVGTYIAMALPLLVALVGSTVDAAILLAYFTLYQQLENYILSPHVTARTMELHPALAFGAAIAGASVSGVVGAFLALPAAAIIQAVASSYVRTHDVIRDDLTREEAAQPVKPPRESAWARALGRLRRRSMD